MRTHTGGVITPLEKYVFHYLPGIPVLIGLCIIFRSDIEKEWCAIRGLLPSTNDALLGFTFFLILLIMVLFTVFLLAMLVDAVRHMFEYAFLTPMWSEYSIADHIWEECNNVADLEQKFNIITKYHETEYFYTEFFGNIAFSLFFLWGVLYWYWFDILLLKSSLPLVALHLVFILRAVFAQFIWKHQKDVAERLGWDTDREKTENDIWINLRLRAWDFCATFASVGLLFLCWVLLWLFYTTSIQAFHYYFIMTLLITSSFEVYLVRFKRFEKTLKGGILQERKRIIIPDP